MTHAAPRIAQDRVRPDSGVARGLIGWWGQMWRAIPCSRSAWLMPHGSFPPRASRFAVCDHRRMICVPANEPSLLCRELRWHAAFTVQLALLAAILPRFRGVFWNGQDLRWLAKPRKEPPAHLGGRQPPTDLAKQMPRRGGLSRALQDRDVHGQRQIRVAG